jgi:hypothetical protein
MPTSNMGTTDIPSDQKDVPRSVRHKRVLDIAEESPDASCEEIAEEIPSITAEYVERVLDEYGDPASEAEASDNDNKGEPDERESTDSLSEFSNKQIETLQAIARNPEATQSELGELLGVSGATVCNRLLEIEEFDWECREEYVLKVLDAENSLMEEETKPMAKDTAKHEADLQELSDRVATVEKQVNGIAADGGSSQPMLDPKLTRKVLHECLQSDKITEDEELELLELFIC